MLHKPTAVIDFAAYLAVEQSQRFPMEYMRNNIVNFMNLLSAMHAAGSTYLIKVSSSDIVGRTMTTHSICVQLLILYSLRHKLRTETCKRGTCLCQKVIRLVISLVVSQCPMDTGMILQLMELPCFISSLHIIKRMWQVFYQARRI